MNRFDYNAHDGIFYHFYQHVQFGLAHDIPHFGHKKNWVEKAGDLGLWAIENFPGKVWKLMKEPRWVTIALTQISLASVSYIFYPKESLALIKVVYLNLPLPPRETIKFALYLTIVAHIFSAALRAYGRFQNDGLMNSWYRGRGVMFVNGAAIIPENNLLHANVVDINNE